MAEKTVVNAAGGRQSEIDTSFIEVPQFALQEVARVMAQGAKRYGRHNWHKISVLENIDHLGGHLMAFMTLAHAGEATRTLGDEYPKLVEEMSHAACRTLMALDQLIRLGQKGMWPPPPLTDDKVPIKPTAEEYIPKNNQKFGPSGLERVMKSAIGAKDINNAFTEV